MKTAKEKTIELIERFKTATTYQYQEYAGANYSTFEHDMGELKKCALICVEEVLNTVVSFPTNLITYEHGEEKEFWLEVKQEIIKL
jgi:hypothetical protein